MNKNNDLQWKTEVARVIENIESVEFTLANIYKFERKFADLFPNNKHIKPKIRQQLQILRDEGLIEFVDNRGRFRKLFVTLEEQKILVDIKDNVENKNFRVDDNWGRIKIRVATGFFRKQVLSNFEYQCSVCRLDMEPLLDAAHIISWSKDPNNRLNPGNGLSMCPLHHRAFDLKVRAPHG